jgi:hypothetical protein
MFPAMHAHTPDKIAAAKFMDEESILQERAEEARIARMQGRKEKFDNAAKLTVAKEKGVCWSSHEPAVATLQPNNSMAMADTLYELCGGTIPKALKCGSNSRRAAAVENLTSQLNEQDKVAALVTALATSLQQHKVRAGIYEDSLDSTAQVPATGEVGSEPQTSASPTLQDVTPTRSGLFSDLAIIRHKNVVQASLIDSVSGMSLVTLTAMAQDCVSALNPSNYPSTPHNCVPANKVDKTARKTSMNLLSHQISLGSIEHFWYLQFGIKFLEDQDSKTTMLLGLSSLMNILPEAINGFALHPLDE